MANDNTEMDERLARFAEAFLKGEVFQGNPFAFPVMRMLGGPKTRIKLDTRRRDRASVLAFFHPSKQSLLRKKRQRAQRAARKATRHAMRNG